MVQISNADTCCIVLPNSNTRTELVRMPHDACRNLPLRFALGTPPRSASTASPPTLTLSAPFTAPSSSSHASTHGRQLLRPWLPSLALSPYHPLDLPEEPVKEAMPVANLWKFDDRLFLSSYFSFLYWISGRI